jgi:hypothetical protein
MAANDKSAKENSKSLLCFVVGPIGKDGSSERKHADLLLNAVIKDVLESEEFGYKVKRADEDADPGMIGDRVITDIIKSPLVVADLTDLNPNAFYELGIRHSTELPTIHIAKAGTPLPFDNVAHRTIFVDLGDWHSIGQARSRLADSVRAISKSDYKVSNPITQANASFKMRQSDDPRDRLLAELQERLASIEASVAKEKTGRPPKNAGRTREDIAEKIRESLVDRLLTSAHEKKLERISKEKIRNMLEEEALTRLTDPEDRPTIEYDGDHLTVSFPKGSTCSFNSWISLSRFSIRSTNARILPPGMVTSDMVPP